MEVLLHMEAQKEVLKMEEARSLFHMDALAWIDLLLFADCHAGLHPLDALHGRPREESVALSCGGKLVVIQQTKEHVIHTGNFTMRMRFRESSATKVGREADGTRPNPS